MNGTYRIDLPAGMMSTWQRQASPNHARLYKHCATQGSNSIPRIRRCLNGRYTRAGWFLTSSTKSKEMKSGKRLLIVAHGNSLRALVKYLGQITDKEIIELNIPTGIPLVYELDSDLKRVRHYYLANENILKDAMAEVADQGKAK